MALGMDMPRRFTTMRGDDGETRAIVIRPGLDTAGVRALLGQLTAVEWADLQHAYGPAVDVPAQLVAVLVGDGATREEAWWNLWGNVHHQGTIYEATVPAVQVLLGVAAWREHPDRAQALLLLREVGAAPGVHVWRYDEAGDVVSSEDEQQRLYPELRSILATGAAPLLDGWRSEPPDLQRALLWLLSVFPDLRADHEDLVGELLPEQHRRAWDVETAGSARSQEEADAVFALEHWVHDGAEG